MNEFQNEVMNLIEERFGTQNLPAITERIAEPDGETIKLEFSDVELWLYPEGANIQTRHDDIRFEKYDYGSLREMGGHIVDRLAQLLQGG